MPSIDLYMIIATLVYMVACMLAVCAGMWVAVSDIPGVKAQLKSWPVLLGAGAVLIGEVLLSAAAIALAALGVVGWSTASQFLGAWMMALPAAVILPGALLVDGPLRTAQGPQNRAVLAGTAMVIALSAVVLAAAAIWPDVVREHDNMKALMSSPAATGLLLLMALLAAPIEEVIFRGGVQGFGEKFLADRGLPRWPAIVAASGVWAIAHGGMMEPAGIKEAQIFALGLVLGWLKRRAGLRGAILAHLALNGLLVAIELARMVAGAALE